MPSEHNMAEGTLNVKFPKHSSPHMNRLLNVLGVIALCVIGLYVGAAALDVVGDILYDLWWWTRRDLLPGLIWAVVIGAVLWVGWGLVSRNGRV